MGATSRQDLFLNITGSQDSLSRVAKAAKATLADLGAASGDLQATMAENFQKLGGSDILNTTRTLEANFRRTFANIRASAEAQIGKPITVGSILSTNIQGAEASLSSAQGQAASLRELADAQARLVTSSPSASAGERALAITLEGGALAAKENVVALEQQLVTLRRLAAEAGVVVGANDEVVAAHGRMSASGMILQHVVRSTTDSFAAGLPPTMIFAEQIGRLGEAAALAGPEGGLGAFGKFMSGPWGLAVTSAISVGSVLVKTLLDDADASDKAKQAKDALKEAVDRLTSSEASLNHQTRQGIIDDINSAAALRQREIATRGLLEAELQRERALAQSTASAPTSGRGLDEGAQATRGAANANANSRIADLDKQLADNQKSITDANKAILSGASKLIQRDIEGRTDPRSAVTQRFQDRADALDRKFQSGGFAGKGGAAEYRRQYNQITDQRDAALESLKPGRRTRADHSTERAANKDRAFQSQLDQAQSAYAKALLGLSDTAQARLAVEQQDLWASLQQKNLELDDQVKAGKLTQAQADKLKAVYAETEELEEISALAKQRSDVMRQTLEKDQAYLDGQIAILQFQKDFAIGSRAQRDLALQILADQEERQRKELNEKLNDPKSSDNDRALARQGLDQIDAQHPYRVAQVNQQTASPLEAKRQQLQQSVGDIHDDVEKVESDAIDHLGDSLESAAMKGLKLHGLLGSIASDLIKLAIQREIELPLLNAMKGGSGADANAGGGIFATIAKLFGGGRAVGGGVSHGKFYMVGEKGPELFAPGMAGTIIPNDNLPVPQMRTLSSADVRGLSRPAQQSPVVLKVEANDYFDAKVSGIAGQHVQRAAPVIANGGAQLAEGRRQRSDRYKL